jgi:hypothetical protein
VSDILFDLIDDGDVTATVVAASEDVTVVTVAGPAGPAGPPGVDDATVVHKVGNETVAGNKTFVGEFAVTTFGLIRNLYVAPPHPGDSARFVLDNENGQTWEVSNTPLGDFSVWDGTAGRGPFLVFHNSPTDAFIINTTTNSMSQPLDMNGNKVTDLATPTAATDAATKGYVDTRPAAPATATSTGTAGQITYDTNFIYVCTATNTWKRAALTTW